MTQPRDRDALLARWRGEQAAPFSGWDFGHIARRYSDEGPDWSYEAELAARARGAQRALDLGTGGGERLQGIRKQLPPSTFATEAHEPNRRAAAAGLAALGIPVVGAHPSRLPFACDSFDLVSSRQTGYRADEVRRVLQPGGTFLTQQLTAGTLADLAAHFGATPPARPTAEAQAARLEEAGLRVVHREQQRGARVFHDVGAVVYLLHNIPWLVEGFDASHHASALHALQAQLESRGTLRFAMAWCLLAARRPAGG